MKPTHYLFSLILLPAIMVGTAFVSQAETPKTIKTATFSMYCYWTGEATLGRVPGIQASRIGHWSGKEIVQVDYDADRTSVEQMASALRKQNSLYAIVVGGGEPAPAGVTPKDLDRLTGKPHFIEPKHSLRTRYPKLAGLDLSEEQAIALNSWSYFGGPMPDILTDAQKAALKARP